MAHILSISYDAALLRTRQLLLEQLGHRVVSVQGFAEAHRICAEEMAHFDLIVLGHSIPHQDKQTIVRECLNTCSCPVLALLRENEPTLEEATYSVPSSEPRAFLAAVQNVVADCPSSASF